MTAKKTIAFLIALPLSAGASALCGAEGKIAEAGVATHYREGTEACDVVVCGEDCPVEVERETLRFVLPAEGNAHVQAKYELYNPTQNEVSLAMYYPVSVLPPYAEESEPRACSVEVEGEPIEAETRYTYCGEVFSPVDEAAAIGVGPSSAAIFNEETTVAERVYSYRGAAEKTFVHLVFDCNPMRSRISFPAGTQVCLSDGRIHAAVRTEGGTGSFTVFLFGEGAVEADSYASDAFGEEREESVEIGQTETDTTLASLAERLRGEECPVGEEDWYNGVLALLSESGSTKGVCAPVEALSERCFRRWYGFHLTVAANDRRTAVVEAPLYPTVVGETARVFRYNYLLSPAWRWRDVKEMRIELDTPLYLASSSLTFEKREGGYAFSRDGLPLGDLYFELSSEEVTPSPYSPYSPSVPAITVALVVLGVAVTITVTVVSVVAVKRKKLLKKIASHGRGETEEGVLPPEKKE